MDFVPAKIEKALEEFNLTNQQAQQQLAAVGEVLQRVDRILAQLEEMLIAIRRPKPE